MGRRSERLLQLLQALRRRRRPVAGQVLAEETGVSLRSLYRDIETLKSLGAAIDGEAGIGFQLRADHWLPPLMFEETEIEALVLGLRTLAEGDDTQLATAARDATAKIRAVLPPARRDEMEAVGLFAINWKRDSDQGARLALLRRALREELELRAVYEDRNGAVTKRVIWPAAIGYIDRRQMLVAWCTLRQDFRSFWTTGFRSLEPTGEHLPEPRRALLHEWRVRHNLPDLGSA